MTDIMSQIDLCWLVHCVLLAVTSTDMHIYLYGVPCSLTLCFSAISSVPSVLSAHSWMLQTYIVFEYLFCDAWKMFGCMQKQLSFKFGFWSLWFASNIWFVWMFVLISVCILISVISVITHVLKWGPAEFMPCQGPCAYEQESLEMMLHQCCHSN